MSKANNINSEFLKIPSTNEFIQLFNKIGNEILELYISTEKGIIYKRDDSPQTKADRLSHSYLSVFLQANSPYPVLSEEDETSIDTKAGGIITDLDGDELEVNPFVPCNKRGIVATNGSNHDKILQAVRKIIKL